MLIVYFGDHGWGWGGGGVGGKHVDRLSSKEFIN